MRQLERWAFAKRLNRLPATMADIGGMSRSRYAEAKEALPCKIERIVEFTEICTRRKSQNVGYKSGVKRENVGCASSSDRWKF